MSRELESALDERDSARATAEEGAASAAVARKEAKALKMDLGAATAEAAMQRRAAKEHARCILSGNGPAGSPCLLARYIICLYTIYPQKLPVLSPPLN